jgi:hypothetical protein
MGYHRALGLTVLWHEEKFMAEQEVKINTRNMKWMMIGVAIGGVIGMPLEAKLQIVSQLIEKLF